MIVIFGFYPNILLQFGYMLLYGLDTKKLYN
jgi:hypothetical protein